jgi:hypothetical protein
MFYKRGTIVHVYLSVKVFHDFTVVLLCFIREGLLYLSVKGKISDCLGAYREDEEDQCTPSHILSSCEELWNVGHRSNAYKIQATFLSPVLYVHIKLGLEAWFVSCSNVVGQDI